MKAKRVETFVLSFTIFVFLFFMVSLVAFANNNDGQGQVQGQVLQTQTAPDSTISNDSADSKVSLRKMHIPGDVNIDDELEEDNSPDDELVQLDKELKTNRKALKQFAKKEGKYNKLKDVVEKMAEKQETLIEARGDYEKVVEDYKRRIECLSNKKRPDCKNILKNGQSNKITDLSSEEPQYQEAVLSVLSNNASSFKRCYQGQLDQGKIFEGDVELFIVISNDGKVVKGDITRISSADKKGNTSQLMTSCLLQTLYSLKFPPTPNGQMVKVVQPIKLSGRRA